MNAYFRGLLVTAICCIPLMLTAPFWYQGTLPIIVIGLMPLLVVLCLTLFGLGVAAIILIIATVYIYISDGEFINLLEKIEYYDE